MIVLTPQLQQELEEALAEAFTPEDLDFKVAEPLKIPVTDRSGARDVRERARALVEWVMTHGVGVDALVKAALDGNPTSPGLRRFAASIGLLAASPEELLTSIGSSLTSRDQSKWISEFGIVQRQVCGIKTQGTSGETQYTGFLVGDDQVMTIGAPILPPPDGAVTFLFEGATLNIHPSAPILVEADHVRVLRLERAIARETAPQTSQVAVRTRGWVAPMQSTAPGGEGDSVIIVQYLSNLLRVAAGTSTPSPTSNELHYLTATYAGSLGAPCFDADWRIVGIHESGASGVNRGRSIDAIVAALHAAGYGWDASRGIHPVADLSIAGTSPHAATIAGEHDKIVIGIAKSISTEDDVWSDDVDDLDLDKGECWAWVEAAAVHATFDPETIRPFGEASRSSRVALLLESRQVGVRWMLNERLRRAAIARLAARGVLQNARARNEEQANDRVDVMLGRLIAQSPLKTDDQRDPDALRALLTATAWLEDSMTELPDAAQLRASLERATLLAPFQHLTQGFFAGRETELGTLTDYCQGPPQAPLFIHAPGGMGKSALLARFVLQMAQRDPASAAEWRPFIYIDFDRPELDASNLGVVLAAIVRQLGPQAPAIADAAQAFLDAQRRTDKRVRPRVTRNKKYSRGSIASQVASSQVDGLVEDVTPLLLQLPGDGPIVMILDTLEEVQFSNPDAIGPLVNLVHQLQNRAPRLRPILAGRIVVDKGVTPMELSGLLNPACVSLLQNVLPKDLATNVALVTRLADIVSVPDKYGVLRGNPLSLRLAAAVMCREANRAAHVIEELDDELRKLVGDAIVQGRLYERVLGHLHDKRVIALAHPGLALRVITSELIRDVLAVPCGLGVIDHPTADKLFNALAEEVALVTQGASGDQLVLRPELRRTVRDDLAKDTTLAAQRQQIHAAAVQYYVSRPLPSDRAEEIYHRLALDEEPEAVDARWITGLEQYLRDAVGELPPRANAYLSNRVGGVVDENQLPAASPLDWEEYALKRATDLLKFGQPQKALDLLAQRLERLPASKLHYVESIAKRMLRVPDLDGAQSAAEAAVVAARASSNNDDLRDALEELVLVRRLRNDSAGVLRALAELADFGDSLGDDLVLLEAKVQGLEAAVTEPIDRAQFTQHAVRVFSRLPDELIAKAPELARRVAAQVGGVEPAILQRVIRIVGTGSLDSAAADSLRRVLEEWRDVDPQISAFIPDESKSLLEIASAARYLASTREMDTLTASLFADWLGSLVSPKSVKQAGRSASSEFTTIASIPKRQMSLSGIEQFILDHCRHAYASVEKLLRELDWRLVPAVLGEIPIRTEPWGVCISNLGSRSRCSWISGRDGLVDSLRLSGSDFIPARSSKHPFVECLSIQPITGTSRVTLNFDVDRLARLASSNEWTSLLGHWKAGFLHPTGELLCFRWLPTGLDRSISLTRVPADLVCQGYIAEGWAWASELGYTTNEQVALQMLGVPFMRKALEEDEVFLAVGDNFEIEKCKNNLDLRQKSLCEYVENLFL